MKIEGLINTFVKLKGNENTRSAYYDDIESYMNFLSSQEITYFPEDEEIAIKYKEFLYEIGYAEATIARKLIVIRKFYKYIINKKKVKLDSNPFFEIDIPKIENISKTEYVPDKKIRQIFDLVETNPKKRIIFYLLIVHGLRVSEICNLKQDDIKLTVQAPFILVSGKRNKKRVQGIFKKEIIFLIHDYMKRNPGEYLFKGKSVPKIARITIYRYVKSIGSAIGIPGLHPHMLRHYAITKYLKAGKSISDVKNFAGHVSITTTDRYDRRIRDVQDSLTKDFNIEGEQF